MDLPAPADASTGPTSPAAGVAADAHATLGGELELAERLEAAAARLRDALATGDQAVPTLPAAWATSTSGAAAPVTSMPRSPLSIGERCPEAASLPRPLDRLPGDDGWAGLRRLAAEACGVAAALRAVVSARCEDARLAAAALETTGATGSAVAADLDAVAESVVDPSMLETPGSWLAAGGGWAVRRSSPSALTPARLRAALDAGHRVVIGVPVTALDGETSTRGERTGRTREQRRAADGQRQGDRPLEAQASRVTFLEVTELLDRPTTRSDRVVANLQPEVEVEVELVALDGGSSDIRRLSCARVRSIAWSAEELVERPGRVATTTPETVAIARS